MEVEPAGNKIARKDEIGVAVPVKVPNTDATTVVDVFEEEDVDGIVFGNGIDKINTSHSGKQVFGLLPTGKTKKEQTDG